MRFRARRRVTPTCADPATACAGGCGEPVQLRQVHVTLTRRLSRLDARDGHSLVEEAPPTFWHPDCADQRFAQGATSEGQLRGGR